MLADIVNKAKQVAEENASAILTAVGVVGTASTAVLTGRATFKAAYIIHKESLQRTPTDDGEVGSDFSGLPDLTVNEKIKLVWPQYIPPVASGCVTIASIIYANRVSSNKAAALAAAYGLKDKAFTEYKEKVLEKFGEKKSEEVSNEIAQDKVNANPPQNIIVVGTGEVLCYDALSDRYFQSTVEKIRQAENAVNFEIAQHDEVSLSRFYEEVGLKVTAYSDTVGWNIDRKCEIQLSTVMTDDGRPCIAVDFARYPEISYHKTWE